jgi:PIN domain nuclease of toxin-antitoxin system
MRLLLDTHAILWFFDGNPALSATAYNAITSPDNTIFLSAASFWEMGIKISLGKLRPGAELTAILDHYVEYGAEILAITADQGLAVEKLPFHHRDPFDRLLVVQAQAEDLTIVSRDVLFDQYHVLRLW